MNENPVVSVIVRTKDRPESVKRSLKSIADQSYRPIETVLVNDGGCELVQSEIQEILGDASLIYKSHDTNKGRAEAANAGLACATGHYVAFLDDDDIYYPQALEQLVRRAQDKSRDVVHGRVKCIEYKYYNSELENYADIVSERVLGEPYHEGRMMFENIIPFNSFLATLSIARKAGPFDAGFEFFEDWDWLIRLARLCELDFLDVIVAEYSVHGIATITGKGGPQLHKRYRERILEKYADRVRTGDFINYIQNVVDRVVIVKDGKIKDLMDIITQQQQTIAELQAGVAARDQELVNLVAHRDTLENDFLQKEGEVKELLDHVLMLENTLNDIYSSDSWRLTKPMRHIGSLLKKVKE